MKSTIYPLNVLFLVSHSFIAAGKTLAEQMTKLKPDWRSALLDDEQNNNPNETADGIPIIDLDDD